MNMPVTRTSRETIQGAEQDPVGAGGGEGGDGAVTASCLGRSTCGRGGATKVAAWLAVGVVVTTGVGHRLPTEVPLSGLS